MNQFTHKLLPVGIIVGSLLFFLVLFQWGIFPFQDQIIKKANTIEADRALQENQENRVKELPQLKDQYNLILENEGQLDTLVSHDQMVPFIENIESLAHENNVEISITNQDQSVKKKPTVAPKKTADGSEDEKMVSGTEKKKKDESIMGNLPLEKYMSLRLDVRGRYADVAHFLYQMESLPYAVDIVALDIRKWESNDAGSRSDAFSSKSTLPGAVDFLEKDISQNLVQAFFDTIVYTKD